MNLLCRIGEAREAGIVESSGLVGGQFWLFKYRSLIPSETDAAEGNGQIGEDASEHDDGPNCTLIRSDRFCSWAFSALLATSAVLWLR